MSGSRGVLAGWSHSHCLNWYIILLNIFLIRRTTIYKIMGVSPCEIRRKDPPPLFPHNKNDNYSNTLYNSILWKKFVILIGSNHDNVQSLLIKNLKKTKNFFIVILWFYIILKFLLLDCKKFKMSLKQAVHESMPLFWSFVRCLK